MSSYKRSCDQQRIIREVIQNHYNLHQQLASVDFALLNDILEVLTEKQIIDVSSNKTHRDVRYLIGQPYIMKPTLEGEDGSFCKTTPMMCRLLGKAYNCTIALPWTAIHYANKKQTVVKVEQTTSLLTIPVTLRSFLCHTSDGDFGIQECPLDRGGYFICKGVEKVVVCPIIEQNNTPYIRCPDPTHGKWTLEYRSVSNFKKRSTSTILFTLQTHRTDGVPQFKISVPFINTPLSLVDVILLLQLPPTLSRHKLKQKIFGEDYGEHKHRIVFDLLDIFLSETSTIAALRKSNAGTETAKLRSLINNFHNEFLPNMCCDAEYMEREKRVSPKDLQRKQNLFFHLVRILLCAYEKYEVTRDTSHISDRDDYMYKRVEHTGGKLTSLTRRSWRPFIKSLSTYTHTQLEEEQEVTASNAKSGGGSVKKNNLEELTRCSTVQQLIHYALATGNWGPEKAGSSQTGISQQHASVNFMAAHSHIDRAMAQAHKEGKDPKPRLLTPSEWGVFCPVESPEGEACGHTHNNTLATFLRIGCNHDLIREVVLEFEEYKQQSDPSSLAFVNVCDATSHQLRTGTRIFVNGCLEGITLFPEEHLEFLRTQRKYGALPRECSIYLSTSNVLEGTRELHVTCDSGTNLRVVNVHELKHRPQSTTSSWHRYPHLFYDQLFLTGHLQLLGKDEEHTNYVAPTAQAVHQIYEGQYRIKKSRFFSEVHCAMLMGLCAAGIPFSDHNQSPRNIYGACMGKQASGRTSSTQTIKCDTTNFTPWYQQKPLVMTRTNAAMGAGDLPGGQNAIVAVLPDRSKNMEDATTLSKTSIDLGMWRTYLEKNHRDEDVPTSMTSAKSMESKMQEMIQTTYPHLDPQDGLALQDHFIEKGDILHLRLPAKSHSTTYRSAHEGRVHNVRYCQTDAGKHVSIVKVVASHRPQKSDKFCSHHGQKGVCGNILPKEDLPYTLSGVTPDMIINPHGQPSRMTVGQMLEGVAAKLQVLFPTEMKATNGTPFDAHMTLEPGDEYLTSSAILDYYDKTFAKLGFKKRGHEQLYSPHTGLPLFSGSAALLYEIDQNSFAKSFSVPSVDEEGTSLYPIYYQALRHFGREKTGCRQIGPYDPITMQPVDGRSRIGGLRFGEMEKDALISIGAPHLIRGRLFVNSDIFPVALCQKCGNEGYRCRIRQGRLFCQYCSSYDTCVETYIPKGFLCTMQDSASMMLKWRLFTNTVSDFDLFDAEE